MEIFLHLSLILVSFHRVHYVCCLPCCLPLLLAYYRPPVCRPRYVAVYLCFTCWFAGLVMSQSQPWPLSQNAAKRSGICSVCFATRQLHLKDGTVHQHGPRHLPCPGSNRPPTSNTSNAHGNCSSTSGSALPYASVSTLASPADTNSSTLAVQSPPVSHPSFTGPIVKHIPRSVRQHIAAELSSVITHICSNPDDTTNY